MKYPFPEIKHIDDVLPAIADAKEFIVAEKEHYKVINYLISTPETFPPVTDLNSAIRRECRGMIFDKDGKIISRRLHKFFNVNERDETQIDQIDLSQPHVILEKLDGSMITPIFVGLINMRWGTKMGVTDVSMNAEEFVARNKNYDHFAWYCHTRYITPIFEWCSRKNRIVVDHPEDRLVLIAMRDNTSGEYATYPEMKYYASKYDIDVVKQYPGTIESMNHLMDETKALEDAEGWIIRFDDGHMLKIKGEWYVKIHKAKDDIGSEKKVLQLLFDEKLDDVKAMLPEEDRRRLSKFETKVGIGLQDSSIQYLLRYIIYDTPYRSRKDFANKIGKESPLCKSILFMIRDVRDIKSEVVPSDVLVILRKVVMKNLSTQEKIDKVRHLWQDHKWEYSPTE